MTALRRSTLFFAIIGLIGAILPSLAYAYDAPSYVSTDCDTMVSGPPDFIPTLVGCMQGSILLATNELLAGISAYMAPTVWIAIALSIAVFGIRITGGEHQLLPKAITTLMKLGLVLMFSNNLGGFSNWIFGIETYLITLASGGFLPWGIMDGFLFQLLGFGPSIAIFQGFLGLIGAAITSSIGTPSIGATLFVPAAMAILNFLLFIFDIVYIYLRSIAIIGMLIVISPFVIPTALFMSTERYVKKWIDMLIATMLMPILLFGFLWMALNIFTVQIEVIFDALTPACGAPPCPVMDATAYGRMNQPTGTWLMPTDPNDMQQGQAMASDPGLSNGPNKGPNPDCPNGWCVQNIPAVGTNINPLQHRTLNAGVMTKPGLDFGNSNISTMGQLMAGFASLWLFSLLMKSMIHKIPEISASIANVVTTVPLEIGRPANERLQEGIHKLKVGTGVAAGGMLGGEAGAAFGHRQLGGMVGALAGANVANKG